MAEALLPEYLNSVDPQGLPSHKLHLRLNAIIMLIRNISIHDLLKCIILTSDKIGKIIFLNHSDEE